MKDLSIREASPCDKSAIFHLLHQAFGDVQGDEISQLVSDLLRDSSAGEAISLVAEVAGKIVGHILFTAVQINGRENQCQASILAPLAVDPAHQGQGIGGHLIQEGLARKKHAGAKLAFVLGHPGYYPRYGFWPAGERGFDAPYPIAPVNATAWMVHELVPGTIGTVRGQIRCATALMDPKHWLE